jgi:hypothetical protein
MLELKIKNLELKINTKIPQILLSAAKSRTLAGRG